MRAAAVLALFLALPAPDPAPAFRARIVDAAALAVALEGPAPPLVLDARGRPAFEAGRIPGSRSVDWRDFSAVRPGGFAFLFRGSSRWGLLAEGPKLSARLRALGLSASRPVVVVVGSPEGWGEEGRIGWMLVFLGFESVALLDGGFEAWRARGGGAIERGPAGDAAAPAGDFEPSPQPERRIGADALKELLASRPVLLDARTPEEFAGKKLTGQARGGRLPGARLVPLASLRAGDGRYVSADALAALAGPLPAGRPVVTYCTGGVRSALLAFLLEARLGVVARNYDGSLWEWSAREELPMEEGAPP